MGVAIYSRFVTKTQSGVLETYLPTIADVRALAGACSRRAPTGIRNRALVLLLASTGLRISEALALRPRDWEAESGWVRVQRGKGDKARTVPVGLPEAVEALSAWLDRRRTLGVTGHRTIFCTLNGGRIQPSYTRALMPRLAGRAGIEGRIHAHGLRHFFAASLAQSRCPVVHIQQALGHSNLGTTSRYLARIAPCETADAVVAAFGRMLSE